MSSSILQQTLKGLLMPFDVAFIFIYGLIIEKTNQKKKVIAMPLLYLRILFHGTVQLSIDNIQWKVISMMIKIRKK